MALVLTALLCCAESPQAKVEIDQLRQQVKRVKDQVAREVDAYKPLQSSEGGKSDLVPLLNRLPRVRTVTRDVAAKNPKTRIIHLRDWHFVGLSDFATELQSKANQELPLAEIERRYEKHLLEVEMVQVEQRAILDCLIQHHGLKHVAREGVTEKSLPILKAKCRIFRHLTTELPQLRRDRADAVKALAKLGTKEGDEYARHIELKQTVDSLLRDYRLDRLRLGVVGHLFLDGKISLVAVEDDEAYGKASPVKAGRVKFDEKVNEAREDAIVRNLIKQGGVWVLILGGGHNLSDNVRRVGKGDCEYIRVTTMGYATRAGD